MTQYNLDPDFGPILEMLPAGNVEMADDEAVITARANVARLFPQQEQREDVRSDDHSIPGLGDDPNVTVRVYTPTAEANGPRGALLHIHGGGWCLGSIDMLDNACENWAVGAGIVVVSVGYRLAPENPYPAALHDCIAALEWTMAQAEALGVDPERIGVGGGSAGGNLAAGVALWARDHDGPAIRFQYLQIPALDDRLETPSVTDFVDTPMLNRSSVEHSFRRYKGPLHGSDDIPYYLAPSRCEDLSGLPPALITTMEFDPLRDEGIIYGLRLLQAGVSVELHSYPGSFHGSGMFPSWVSDRQTEETISVLRRRLAEGK